MSVIKKSTEFGDLMRLNSIDPRRSHISSNSQKHSVSVDYAQKRLNKERDYINSDSDTVKVDVDLNTISERSSRNQGLNDTFSTIEFIVPRAFVKPSDFIASKHLFTSLDKLSTPLKNAIRAKIKKVRFEGVSETPKQIILRPNGYSIDEYDPEFQAC